MTYFTPRFLNREGGGAQLVNVQTEIFVANKSCNLLTQIFFTWFEKVKSKKKKVSGTSALKAAHFDV